MVHVDNQRPLQASICILLSLYEQFNFPSNQVDPSIFCIFFFCSLENIWSRDALILFRFCFTYVFARDFLLVTCCCFLCVYVCVCALFYYHAIAHTFVVLLLFKLYCCCPSALNCLVIFYIALSLGSFSSFVTVLNLLLDYAFCKTIDFISMALLLSPSAAAAASASASGSALASIIRLRGHYAATVILIIFIILLHILTYVHRYVCIYKQFPHLCLVLLSRWRHCVYRCSTVCQLVKFFLAFRLCLPDAVASAHTF